MLSWRAHGSAGLRSWIFYTITPCNGAFHMTSIVVSLYFKQENCETLISLYNWGRMKRCQSQLVSCKVEWFCSLAGFSWWPGLSSFLPASVCPFCRSRSALCARFHWRAEKKALVKKAWGEGCIIRANYSCASAWPVPASRLPACCPAAPAVSICFAAEINKAHSASAAVVVCLVCIEPNEKLILLSFFIMLHQTLHK